jgi:hypothetical protein
MAIKSMSNTLRIFILRDLVIGRVPCLSLWQRRQDRKLLQTR